MDIRPTLLLHFRAVIQCSVKCLKIITFRVSHRRREMYCCHITRICVCVCVCLSVCLSMAKSPHHCMDPDVTWGSGRGCPLVVHYWLDLQSVHGLCCNGNVMRTRNVSEYMLVLDLCLVFKSYSTILLKILSSIS